MNIEDTGFTYLGMTVLLRWDVPEEGKDSRLAFSSFHDLSGTHLQTVLDTSFRFASNSSLNSNPMLSPHIPQAQSDCRNNTEADETVLESCE
jgi:hypothetical protein